MAITGKKRETVNFEEQPKYVGLFVANVIAVNPTAAEYEALTGRAPKEDSKQVEYLGESEEGNTTLRVDFWLEENKERKRPDGNLVKEKFKLTFFLENKERVNKDSTRTQYVNNIGAFSWASDPNDLPDWFKVREYRVAKAGEEQLYNFMKKWMSGLNLRDEETIFDLDWRALMRGNLKEIKSQINGEYSNPIVCLATIGTSERDGEIKEYQKVYNGDFLPPYSLSHFRLMNYGNPENINKLKARDSKKLKIHEKFVLDVAHSEYGCKDYFVLRDMELYNPEDNLAASDKVMTSDGSDY